MDKVAHTVSLFLEWFSLNHFGSEAMPLSSRDHGGYSAFIQVRGRAKDLLGMEYGSSSSM